MADRVATEAAYPRVDPPSRAEELALIMRWLLKNPSDYGCILTIARLEMARSWIETNEIGSHYA